MPWLTTRELLAAGWTELEVDRVRWSGLAVCEPRLPRGPMTSAERKEVSAALHKVPPLERKTLVPDTLPEREVLIEAANTLELLLLEPEVVEDA